MSLCSKPNLRSISTGILSAAAALPGCILIVLSLFGVQAPTRLVWVSFAVAVGSMLLALVLTLLWPASSMDNEPDDDELESVQGDELESVQGDEPARRDRAAVRSGDAPTPASSSIREGRRWMRWAFLPWGCGSSTTAGNSRNVPLPVTSRLTAGGNPREDATQTFGTIL